MRFTPTSLILLTASVLCIWVHPWAANASELEDWAELLSFRPDETTQSKLLNRKVEPGEKPWAIQKVERARGDLLLESTSLVVTKLPAVNGNVLSPHGLLAYVRRNMNTFMEGEKVKFGPLSEEDRALWETDAPLNAAVEFTPQSAAFAGRQSAWLVSEVRRDEWRLTSVQPSGKATTPNPWSGNRVWGVMPALPLDGCVVYTRAALRAHDAPTPNDEKTLAAESADAWRSVFERIKVWVEDHGGTVVPNLLAQQSTLVPWAAVAKQLHTPKIPWQDLDGTWRSKDAGKRFTIVFRGLEAPCDFVERNKDGGEVRVQVPLQAVPGERDKQGQPVATYLIERSNEDAEVLRFYKFSAGLVSDIIAAKPKPSKLILRRTGDKLVGEWLGLSISRDAAGRLAQIQNPGDQPGRSYEFAPDGP